MAGMKTIAAAAGLTFCGRELRFGELNDIDESTCKSHSATDCVVGIFVFIKPPIRLIIIPVSRTAPVFR